MILLDFAMPGLSGVDVLGIIKVEFPDVPVIIMSGYVTDKPEVAALGATDVLQKPFRLRDVEQRLKSVLDK